MNDQTSYFTLGRRRSIRLLAPTLAPLLLLLTNLNAQRPADAPKQLKIDSVTLEQGALPGTNRAWIKLVATFRSAPRWADGIAFSFTALLGANNQYHIDLESFGMPTSREDRTGR